MLASRPKPLSAHLRDFTSSTARISDQRERRNTERLISSATPLANTIERDAARAAALQIDSEERRSLDVTIEANEGRLRPILQAIFVALGIHVPEHMNEITVRFTMGPRLNRAEYIRQLNLQQAGINAMMVQDWIANRNRYAEHRRSQTERVARGELSSTTRPSGRDPRSARAQANLRVAIRANLIDRLMQPENAGGRLSSQPAVQANLEGFVSRVFARYTERTRRRGLGRRTATLEVDRWLRTQHVLHSPDQVAGGRHDDLTGLGNARVNQDIGANWGGFEKPVRLADHLHRDVVTTMNNQRIERAFWRNVKMHVKLTI
jgi:hypothetical protein